MKKSVSLSITFMMVFFISNAQSGIIWNAGMNIAPSTSGNQHPRIAVDGNGNPLVVWHHANRATFSRWNGTVFATPVMLNPMSMTVAGASWMGPDIASHGDTVYVVFKQTPEASDTCHIFCVHSYDGGVTFSAPVQVDNIADSISRFPAVTTDYLGNPVVAFMKFDPLFMDARWVVAKSSDYGNSFSTDVKASGWSNPGADVCDCCPGAVINSGNTIAMLYRDNNSNIRDSWAGISIDSGTTFTSGVNIDQHNWMIMACPSTGPDGIIMGDTLYSVFMNGATGSSRTYFSKTSLSNLNVTSNLLTGNIPGLTYQNYPRIDIYGNAAAIVWKQHVSSADQLPVLFTNNLTNGLPVVYDTVDLGNITNADVALSNDNIFVVWQDDNSGTIKYRSGIYNPSTTDVLETEKSSFSIYPNPSSEFINITTGNKEKYSVTITNILNDRVFSVEATDDLRIQTIGFPKGMYFVQVKSTHHTFTQKFIKQ